MSNLICGNVVDVFSRRIFPAEVEIRGERIRRITEIRGNMKSFILPGLIDSHIHIESSMLSPAGFSALAVRHGTVAVVSDPHEIANVAGVKGINYMIRSGDSVPLKFYFGAPSCVPATDIEESGAVLDSKQIAELLKRDDLYFLSEIMNFPGVINSSKSVLDKIKIAHKLGKPVDGHAPGLRGHDLDKYIKAGITTDHECINFDEAEEKISKGMKIQIREGSAAKGFDLFFKLIDKYPDFVMLCSDDKHPDDLIKGHINELLARGVRNNIDVFNLIRAATVNPALHYKLPVGLLREGDPADMIIVDNIEDFRVKETYINGNKIYDEGKILYKSKPVKFNYRFQTKIIQNTDVKISNEGGKIRVIEANDGQLFTGSLIVKPKVEGSTVVSDPARDICKIVVVNKYKTSKPSIGFITGFGLKKGAIAGSVAHDNHNIIAVGVDDDDLVKSINIVIEMQGGLAVTSGEITKKLQLEIAGLMSNMDGEEVALRYLELDNYAKYLGSSLSAPFMTLSFMSLLVIPELKICNNGLFDVNQFKITSLFTDSDFA